MTEPAGAPRPPAQDARGRGGVALAALAALACVALAFLVFPSTVEDDAYITYWPATTLAESGEIVNYNGERVEQSSTLLLTLVLGLVLRVTGLAAPLAAPLLSGAAAGAAVLLTGRLAGRFLPGTAPRAALLAATAPCLVYWALSGMETTLAATAAACFLGAVARVPAGGRGFAGTLATFAATTAFVLVRPENGFVAAAAVAAIACIRAWTASRHRGDGSVPGASSMLLPGAAVLAAVAATLAFRWVYFGALVPQPVSAKVDGPGLGRAAQGASYLLHSAVLRPEAGFWLAALVGAFLVLRPLVRGGGARPAGTDPAAAAAFLAAQLSFIVTSGGDWMPASRFLAPALPAATVLATVALAAVPRRAWARGAFAGIVLLNGVSIAGLARQRPGGAPLWSPVEAPGVVIPAGHGFFETRNAHLLHDAVVLGDFEEVVSELGAAEGRRTTVLSGQMGFVPFHLARRLPGRLRFVDRFSLCTRDFDGTPLAARAPRTKVGRDVGYVAYFAMLREDPASAGVPPPDVIWDWDMSTPLGDTHEVVVRNGYVCVYLGRGVLANRTTALGGADAWAGEFIAVRSDLADRVRDRGVVRFRPVERGPSLPERK